MEALNLFTFNRFRRIFYLVTPNETTFEKLEDVPDYLDQSTPWFLLMIVMEIVYSYVMKKDYFRSNDGITNGNSGMLQQALKTIFCGFEFSMACWIYDNYGLRILPWDSIWTWILSFLLVDLSYYWFHRGAHEINFFWAFHQMHHSSEDYNFTTASRQSMFQQYVAIFFHLPEAFLLPPPAHLAHLTLNKVNQFWVHTQVIKSLGPLEHILVTPSHHRVHHGRNSYCIDKNYSGTFIIWDKIFGTFQAEKPEEPVVYGLVHNINTFDAVHCQFYYLKYLFLEKVPSMTNFVEKLKAVVYGPGWFPGKPRLGSISDIPDIKYPVIKYDPEIPRYIWFYCNLQFTVTVFFYFALTVERIKLSNFDCIIYLLILAISVQCSSAFLDNKSYAPSLELLRCVIIHFWFLKTYLPPVDVYRIIVKYIMGTSFWFWFIHQTVDNVLKISVKLKND